MHALCVPIAAHRGIGVDGDEGLELPPLEQRAFLPQHRIQQLADGPGDGGSEEHEEGDKPGQVGANLGGRKERERRAGW